jgi:amidase
MARRVADLGLLLDVLAGPAPREAPAWRLRLPEARAANTGLRVAAWLDDETCPVSAEVAGVLGAAVAALGDAGYRIDCDARPGIAAGEHFRLFLQLMYAEMSAGFPEGVFRAFGAAARRPVTDGEWTPLSVMPAAVTQSHREWLGASEAREGHRAAWADFFERFDVLVTPVAPTTALPHDHRPFEERTITLRGREYAYMQQSFWCGLATLAGLPAAVVPAGVAADGLPVGLQIVGPLFGERTVLEFAAGVEQVLGTLSPALS